MIAAYSYVYVLMRLRISAIPLLLWGTIVNRVLVLHVVAAVFFLFLCGVCLCESATLKLMT